jgi:hypothetical protein
MALSLFDEHFLRNFLATFAHQTRLALLLPLCDFAVDRSPAHCCAVLAEAPFLEPPLVLAFAVAMSAAWIKLRNVGRMPYFFVNPHMSFI